MFWMFAFLGLLAMAVVFFRLWRRSRAKAIEYESSIQQLVREFGKTAFHNLFMLAKRRGFTCLRPEPVVNDRSSFWAVELLRVMSQDDVLIVNFNITWAVPYLKMPQITLVRYIEGSGQCTDAYPLTEFYEALERAREALEGFHVSTGKEIA